MLLFAGWKAWKLVEIGFLNRYRVQLCLDQ